MILLLFFLHVHAKMITLGSRCLTGCEPVYCYSAVASCAMMMMLLTGSLDDRLAGWLDCSVSVDLWFWSLSGLGATLSLHRSYCFTQYSSPTILRYSHVPAERDPVSDLYALWCFGVYLAQFPFAQLPNQCLITFSDSAFPAERQSHCM